MTTQTILLRFADLKARGFVRNRTTLSRWIRKLDFPPGIMMGVNTRVWTEAEIEAWLAERARASAETAATIVLVVVTYGFTFMRAAA